MGFENITKSGGLEIAAIGMTVVFAALTLIAVFIHLLPKILESLEPFLPSEPPARDVPQATHSNNEAVAAAIGFALHREGKAK